MNNINLLVDKMKSIVEKLVLSQNGSEGLRREAVKDVSVIKTTMALLGISLTSLESLVARLQLNESPSILIKRLLKWDLWKSHKIKKGLFSDPIDPNMAWGVMSLLLSGHEIEEDCYLSSIFDFSSCKYSNLLDMEDVPLSVYHTLAKNALRGSDAAKYGRDYQSAITHVIRSYNIECKEEVKLTNNGKSWDNFIPKYSIVSEITMSSATGSNVSHKTDAMVSEIKGDDSKNKFCFLNSGMAWLLRPSDYECIKNNFDYVFENHIDYLDFVINQCAKKNISKRALVARYNKTVANHNKKKDI